MKIVIAKVVFHTWDYEDAAGNGYTLMCPDKIKTAMFSTIAFEKAIPEAGFQNGEEVAIISKEDFGMLMASAAALKQLATKDPAIQEALEALE